MSVSSSIGPVSGIDYGKLIDGLSAIDQKPIDSLKTQVQTLKDQNDAFTSLATDLTGLKIAAASFATSAIFRAANANSSDPSVLTATAGIGTPIGSYQLTVERLASASQVATQGFSSTTNPLGLSGALTFQFGKGNLDPVLKLAELNGGKGVGRGSIRITDRTGSAAVIDLSRAVDITDVVDAINNAINVNVSAALDGDKLVLTDRSGGTGNFSVSNVGKGTTATDLGIVASVAANTLAGSDINKLGNATTLNSLNDGNGVRTAGILDDFSVTGHVGSANISLNGAKTLADVLAKINAQTSATGVTAAVSADGHGIALSDGDGATTPAVAALNSSLALRDLGLTKTTTGAGTLSGERINAGLDSALLRELRGGSGIGLGTIHIANRAGGGADVDLSAAKTVQDVLQAINASGAGVTAGLNGSGTALVITDTTGATAGNLTITDSTGTAAADLGLAQNVSAGSIAGADMHLRYISNNTALSTLNAGAGFKPGKIRLTDSTGKSFTVDLSGQTITTVGDVLNQINNAGLGLKASINTNGNGILLTDSAGGTVTPKIEEVDGTTAASLGLAGAFSNNQLDGSLQKTVTVAATDTLNDIMAKINQAGIGVAAQVINDGSDTPYRLSLSSRNSGAAANLIFSGDAAGISATQLVKGQDAVALYGNGTSTLQVTSATNTLSTLVPSMTIALTGTGTATINVTRDNSKITDAIQKFVDQYNKVQKNIADLTKFDLNDSKNNGKLFGDSTVQTISQGLGSFIARVFNGVGPLKTLSAVGIKLEQDGTLTLDSDKLNSALTNNPDDVRTLFTTNVKAVTPDFTKTPPIVGSPAVQGIGAALADLLDRYVNGQTGLLFQTENALTTRTTQLNKRITSLNELLLSKKNRLILQFANLEKTIAGLQSQGTALSNFKPATSTSSSK